MSSLSANQHQDHLSAKVDSFSIDGIVTVKTSENLVSISNIQNSASSKTSLYVSYLRYDPNEGFVEDSVESWQVIKIQGEIFDLKV